MKRRHNPRVPAPSEDAVRILHLFVQEKQDWFLIDIAFRGVRTDALGELRPFTRAFTLQDPDASAQESALLDELARRQGVEPITFEPMRRHGASGMASRVVFQIPDDAYCHAPELRFVPGRDVLVQTSGGAWRYTQPVTRTPVTVAAVDELRRMQKQPGHAHGTTPARYLVKLLLVLDEHWR